MKGLLIKDLINLRQQAKVYLMVIATWLVIGIASKDSGFFGGVMIMLAIMVPITAISYDEKAGWEKYALTMPVTRAQLVLSKYALGLLCVAASYVLSIIFSLACGVEGMEALTAGLVFAAIGMAYLAIVLPIMFRFGPEKGRMLMMVVFLTPFLLIMLLSKMNLPLPSAAQLTGLAILGPVLLVLLLAASVLISLGIYARKEF